MRIKIIPERILAIRTDRLGDVLLTTPAFRALKMVFPASYLAVLVQPYTAELVEDNPYLDEVISYDKKRGIREFLRLVGLLRKKKFDLAIVFNPRFRNNLIAACAGIRWRMSYQDRGGWLANIRVKNEKYLDRRHEVDWNLNFVRRLGGEGAEFSRDPVLVVKKEAEQYIDNFLKSKGIDAGRLVVIHPGATTPSKRWPAERFAQVAEELQKTGSQIIIVGGREEKEASRDMLARMDGKAGDATGLFNLQQLSGLIKKSRLLISNDAGPVHIAGALGTPHIVIFGRKLGGLGPANWGPVTGKGRFLQKDAGCEVCLADRCRQNFACLWALSVDEVVGVAKDLLEERG